MAKSTYALGVAALALILVPGAPAMAGDDSEDIALAAALGLTAADGKTTLSGDAGKIEAALLMSDAIDEAGKRIVAATNTARAGRKVAVIDADDSVDLLLVSQVRREILHTISNIKNICPSSIEESAAHTYKLYSSAKPELSDAVALIAVSKNYGSVETSFKDRMLLNAVSIHGSNQGYVLPAEIAAASAASDTITLYDLMVKSAKFAKERCKDDKAQSAIEAVENLAISLTELPKEGPSTLIAATQYETLLGGDGSLPLILRTTIEQQGGTSITRSGILYTLGFPGAAQISAGLIASYRLVEPDTGQVKAAGFVLCVVKPVNIGRVARIVQNGDRVGTTFNESPTKDIVCRSKPSM